MAHDIMSPLLLVPNVKTIYSIDSFDPCFSSDKTWEGQKQDIKQVLTQGNDFDTRTYHCYTRYPEKSKEIHYLSHTSTIITDIDDGKKWTLIFKYGRYRIIELIYYHNRDFYDPHGWPTDIQNINHIMGMGAPVFYYGIYNNRQAIDELTQAECDVLVQQFKERTSKSGYIMYALNFLHEHWPEKITIKNGHQRNGEIISIYPVFA